MHVYRSDKISLSANCIPRILFILGAKSIHARVPRHSLPAHTQCQGEDVQRLGFAKALVILNNFAPTRANSEFPSSSSPIAAQPAHLLKRSREKRQLSPFNLLLHTTVIIHQPSALLSWNAVALCITLMFVSALFYDAE